MDTPPANMLWPKHSTLDCPKEHLAHLAYSFYYCNQAQCIGDYKRIPDEGYTPKCHTKKLINFLKCSLKTSFIQRLKVARALVSSKGITLNSYRPWCVLCTSASATLIWWYPALTHGADQSTHQSMAWGIYLWCWGCLTVYILHRTSMSQPSFWLVVQMRHRNYITMLNNAGLTSLSPSSPFQFSLYMGIWRALF